MKYKIINKLKEFLVGISFMTVFGIIDNGGLFIGMDAIENKIISMGYSSLVAAGIGNAFSDAIGALCGGYISNKLYKILKINGSGTIIQQTIGVVIGCMIPVIILMLLTK
ncbi:TMEM65 family protein [bacterium]|jgi:hypothetical protein|nr:TMEM65 family protein [bacterium]